jgi:hypothetical protein
LTVSFAMRVRTPPDVLVRELGGESVLLNLKSERYFGLDATGTRIWQVLSTSDSIQSAYDLLLAEYEVEGDALKRDLHQLVEQLLEHGLIEVSHE